MQPRRLRDRRRDPLLPRREQGLARRTAVGAQLGAVPRARPATTTSSSIATSARRSNPTGRRKLYRYQVQGPTALKVLEKATGGPLPEIKFFNMGELTIAGHKVRALHHGMSGAPGPRALRPVGRARRGQGRDRRGRPRVRPAPGRLARVRDEHARVGLDPVPAPGRVHRRRDEALPRVAACERLRGDRLARRQLLLRRHRGLLPDAVGPRLRPLRQATTTTSSAARRSRRWDEPTRRKVTLAWNGEDVAKAIGTLFREGRPAAKYIDFPLSNYSTWPNDRLMAGDHMVGVSTFSGYSYNERSYPLARRSSTTTSRSATRSTLVWGEEGGGSAKPVVEPHVQAEIRADRQPVPVLATSPARRTQRAGARRPPSERALREQLAPVRLPSSSRRSS